MKENEGISQSPYMYNPIDTKHSVAMARGKRGWGLGEGGQGEWDGDICNRANSKNKVTKSSVYNYISLSKHILKKF